MALPVILFNSSSGSDTAASGAGPSTALTGSNASTSGDGLTVTLDGSPDLSGVATDGSAVIYLADATAGARNFGKITAVDNGADTVTVSNAFGVSLSGKSWAIGGKRATIGHTASRKLGDNNSAAGDAMPGWILELEDDQSVSTTSFTMRRSGDNTTGPIILRGNSNTTRRAITQTSNTGVIICNTGSNIKLQNLHLKNSNGTKTQAYGVNQTGNNLVTWIENCILGDATNQLLYGVYQPSSAQKLHLYDSVIQHTTNHGILGGSTAIQYIRGAVISSAGGSGVAVGSGASAGVDIINSLIYDCATDGINTNQGSILSCINCTIANNGGDGIDLSSNSGGSALQYMLFVNNSITGNGGYGVRGHTGLQADINLMFRKYNNFGTGASANTSGAATNWTLDATDLQVDPGYADEGAGDFAPGANLKAAGWPVGFLGGGAGLTPTYIDIGAAQRAEPAGGGLLVHPGMAGGMRG